MLHTYPVMKTCLQSQFNIPDTFIRLFSFSLVSEVIEHTPTYTSLGVLSTLYLLYAALTATTVASFCSHSFPFHFLLVCLNQLSVSDGIY